ncbi:MAG: DUF1206 domain-containing protein [Nocardioides sp.]|nr:DUF1206 domain-containing protein [Nocardioides sp.]
MTNVQERAHRVGRWARGDDWHERVGGIGMVTYGLVHVVIAVLALELALGHQGKNASTMGAMATLAQSSYGLVVLWLIGIGMFLLVAWRAVQTLSAFKEFDGLEAWWNAAIRVGTGLLYGYLGYLALRYGVGAGISSSGPQSTTASVMDMTLGRWLVGLAGLVVLGFGVGFIVRGSTGQFLEILDREGRRGGSGRVYRIVGTIGHIAKGIAFGIVGGLVGYAALTHEPRKSGGLDQALHTVLQQPFGPFLLMAIALGFACFGLFCFARARHLSR